MNFRRAHLETLGFLGFESLKEVLQNPRLVPDEFGLYVIVRPVGEKPRFLSSSRAGWFKKLDPSYPLSRIRAKWVPSAEVIYIGKAGPTASRTLRKRVNELLRFGAGEPLGHRGGRALWHVPDILDCSLAWQVYQSDPRGKEKAMLADFEQVFGAIPFANFNR